MMESRIARYAREQRSRTAVDDEINALADELDQSERTNLRLNHELLEETTQRVRLERMRDNLKTEVQNLSLQVSDLERKLDEQIGLPTRIGKGRKRPRPSPEVPLVVQRIDGGVASKRQGDGVTADQSRPQRSGGSSGGHSSSRVRGGAR